MLSCDYFTGMASFCPTQIVSVVRLLASRSWSEVTPYFLVSPQMVSPFATVCVEAVALGSAGRGV